jgi:peptide/nickel transport system substrate-binding protein/oligopeptide transport system substrate-binding protein
MLDCGYFGELVQNYIVGVQAGGEYDDMANVGVKASEDNRKVTYTLTAEADDSYFLTMLEYSTFAPLNRAYYTAQGEAYGTGYDHILYNGAYRIKTFTSKNTFEFVANDKYYDAANVDIKTITWLFNDGSDATFGQTI